MSEAAELVLFDAANGVYIAPIRHHSPACALYLRAMISELAPVMLLIEGPSDYDALLPLIASAETKPPVAIVSIADIEGAKEEMRSRIASYFPFCGHSPEYVAILEAKARGIEARFIDLPAAAKEMRSDAQPERVTLQDEQRFDSSTYVRVLAARLGCRDGNEAWDHLFESQIAETGWRRFFSDVGRYCAHIRESTAASVMEADGTNAREARMIAHLAAARRAAKGPIVVVVGGFHAPALAAAASSLATIEGPVKTASARPPYLIRYGFRQLNALTGYGAGLPLPGYYAALWSKAINGSAKPFDDLAHDLLMRFVTHLRDALPGINVPVPALVATLEAAHRLAELRGRPGPLRDDLIDACRSNLLKGEEGGDLSPVMAELAAFLTGSAIGDIPASAGSPPLVEAVRARARALGFRIDDGERRARELDIYRKPRHRLASQFLHATVFLDCGFAQRTGGPDFRSGVDLDRLIEHWSVMWSPLFEARLIDLSVDGDTIEQAVAVELGRRIRALEARGQGGNAAAAIDLYAAACQAGAAGHADAVLPLIDAEVTRDPDLATVTMALRDLVALWRGRAALGLADGAPIEHLIAGAWRRVLSLLPDLVHAGEDRITTILDAMATLREVIDLSGKSLPALDTELFDEAVAHLFEAELDPALAGAIAALALLSGKISEEDFAARLSGELRGAYTEAARRVSWLRGVIAISRELLWRIPSLVETTDGLLGRLSDADFIELLPHLRLALARLDPREIDRLAHAVAARHSIDAASLVVAHQVTEAELADNLRADRLVAEMLASEGLA